MTIYAFVDAEALVVLEKHSGASIDDEMAFSPSVVCPLLDGKDIVLHAFHGLFSFFFWNAQTFDVTLDGFAGKLQLLLFFRIEGEGEAFDAVLRNTIGEGNGDIAKPIFRRGPDGNRKNFALLV